MEVLSLTKFLVVAFVISDINIRELQTTDESEIAEQLVGDWVIKSYKLRGEERDTLDGYIFSFSNDGSVSRNTPSGEVRDRGHYWIDASTNPVRIDFMMVTDRRDIGGEGRRLGILKIEHDEQMKEVLTICINNNGIITRGDDRPDDFEFTKDDRRESLYVLQRPQE